ncbi:MAG: zinc ribbon domain-containing protein [Solirubrobacterales bacterium]
MVNLDDLPAVLPAVILNLKSFGAAVLVVVALLVAVTLLYRHPSRRCHQCGQRVRLDQRVCRHCGYDFEPVRTSR